MATQFETDLLNALKMEVKAPITLVINGLIVFGATQLQEKEGQIIMDDAKVVMPDGKTWKYEQLVCRIESISAFATGAPDRQT